jgi:nucleoside triphosphate diphosphatase
MDISKLLDIVARLRDPEHGCPWDREQTFETIAPYTIEEAYEVADAIEREALEELPGELGDLLFQVVFHARMAEEQGRFDFAAVVEHICAKLLRRHPHVFGGESIETAAGQSAAWDRHKQAERQAQGHTRVLEGVARALPALKRAEKLGLRAARVGFEWPELAGAWGKLAEELGELDAAIAADSADEAEDEAGDVLFAVVNVCRHLGIDPEQALRRANRRFEQRFGYVERRVEESGRGWQAHDLDALESYWQQAKRAGH